MEEGVYDRNNNRNEKYGEGENEDEKQIMIAPQLMKVKE